MKYLAFAPLNQPTSNGLQPTSDGLQPKSYGLQPKSYGLQASSEVLDWLFFAPLNLVPLPIGRAGHAMRGPGSEMSQLPGIPGMSKFPVKSTAVWRKILLQRSMPPCESSWVYPLPLIQVEHTLLVGQFRRSSFGARPSREGIGMRTRTGCIRSLHH